MVLAESRAMAEMVSSRRVNRAPTTSPQDTIQGLTRYESAESGEDVAHTIPMQPVQHWEQFSPSGEGRGPMAAASSLVKEEGGGVDK